MNRILHLLLSCLLFSMIIAQDIRAQENAPIPEQKASEVESLGKKLEEQEKQIKSLQQSLQSQSELIERQQRVMEELQKKIELPPTAPVAAPASTQSASGDAKPAKPAAKAIQSVESGFGKIKFNGLMQGWYAAGNEGFRDTFRLRRTELKFSGEITPKIKWTLMIDPSKALSVNNTYTTINGTKVMTDTSVSKSSLVLQDAFISVDLRKNVRVDIGQYKIPLSQEGSQSSAALDTIERALFMSDRARGGGLGDIRDVGVTVRSTLRKYFDVQVGLFNGSGETQNDVDKNDSKALIGRLVVRPPFIKGLQVGGSGAWGNGTRGDRPRRDRLGGELQYVNGPFKFKTEYMSGKDSDLHRAGYYTHFGYKITPKIEAIFRFDSWDPDTRRELNSANVTERDYIAGVNYYISENNVKLQFNYLRKTFKNDIVPSRNLILVNLQTSW